MKRGADYIGGLASPITAFLILSLMLLTSQTWGQTDTSGTDEERTWHEEIIVTAEKVEENILDVPMTISAFDSKSLEEHVLQDKTDLQSLVPGLQFGDEMDQEGREPSVEWNSNRGSIPRRPCRWNQWCLHGRYIRFIARRRTWSASRWRADPREP